MPANMGADYTRAFAAVFPAVARETGASPGAVPARGRRRPPGTQPGRRHPPDRRRPRHHRRDRLAGARPLLDRSPNHDAASPFGACRPGTALCRSPGCRPAAKRRAERRSRPHGHPPPRQRRRAPGSRSADLHGLQRLQYPDRPLRGPDLHRRGDLPGRARESPNAGKSSPDGLAYTFHLRAGARWSNGDPVTAADFVYSFRRILSPALASEYSYLLYPIRNARGPEHAAGCGISAGLGAQAQDAAHPPARRWSRPCPYLPALAAHQAWFPVHRPTIERFGAFARRGTAWTRPGNLVGNGPFLLKEWMPNARLVVGRNPRYWDAGAQPPQRRRLLSQRQCRHRRGQLPRRPAPPDVGPPAGPDRALPRRRRPRCCGSIP